jgi:hypothetical protein
MNDNLLVDQVSKLARILADTQDQLLALTNMVIELKKRIDNLEKRP